MMEQPLDTLIDGVRQFGRAVAGERSTPADVDIGLLARVAQASRTSMILTDADLDEPGPRILWVNPAFERTTGYASVDVVGRSPRFLQGPATDRSVLAQLRMLLTRGEDFEGEAINYRADGSAFVMSWRITALVDSTGTATHYLATQDDVTELRLRPLEDREAILDLQTALMPEVPPTLGGYDFGSAYRPTDGQLVGGDWIDVLAVDGSETLAVVGDVTGHGAAAVAAMGQMQWAIRATAAAGLPLGRVLFSLRTLALSRRQYATAVFLKLMADGRFRYATAGHPPPLIVEADGTVRELESTGPMVGLGAGTDETTASDRIEPGSMLVAFTDGLFERRRVSVIDGLDRLRHVVASMAGEGLGPREFAEQLVARMITDDSGEDDIAALVVCRSATASLATEQQAV